MPLFYPILFLCLWQLGTWGRWGLLMLRLRPPRLGRNNDQCYKEKWGCPLFCPKLLQGHSASPEFLFFLSLISCIWIKPVFSFQFPRFLCDTNTQTLSPSKKTVVCSRSGSLCSVALPPQTPLPVQTLSLFNMLFGNVFRIWANTANPKVALCRSGTGDRGRRQKGDIANAFVLFRLRSHDASIPVKRLNIKVGLLCRRSRTACEKPRHEVH